jgi:CRISPR/Cas system-associated exonuclease Cas4 (RecB family)
MKKEKLERLLSLEKERRGVKREKLVFVGTADVAQYYWCAMQAVFRSRENELNFFDSYLADRLTYAKDLGLIDELPGSDEALLEAGQEIRLADVEKLLKQKAKKFTRHTGATLGKMWRTKDGELVAVVNPYIEHLFDKSAYSSEELAGVMEAERTVQEKKFKAEGARIANLEEFPKLRGEFLQVGKAEQYPTIRWNFAWEGYAVVGVPDGITDKFVYEFKTTGSRFLMRFEKPVALTQADLYGYFFKRDRKRVQIYVKEKDTIETWEEEVDKTAAIKVLENFRNVDGGWVPPPPKTWKCKRCEFKSVCKLVKAL